MIDTVILSLPKTKIITLDRTAGGDQPWDLQAQGRGYSKHIKNPSLRDIATGQYFPRLTYFRRKSELESRLKIEFSAPKLLRDNNLDELSDSQLYAVVDALRSRLEEMGVIITTENLGNAPVAAVHYSKNIELKDGFTTQYVIRELGKINLNKRFDFSRSRYLNDGMSLYAHTIAHSFIIYDKIADLRRGEKKSIDRDQTAYQVSLFEKLDDVTEILRLEVRLSQKRKMNALFKQFGWPENPTFRDVFSSQKSKAVLNHYWDTMIRNNSLVLFAHSPTPKDLIGQILVGRQKAKVKTAIYLTGLLVLSRDSNGLRELRAILEKRANNRTWYRLVGDLKNITADLEELKPREWYNQVNRVLGEYKPFKLST